MGAKSSGPESSADISREHDERCAQRSLTGTSLAHIMHFYILWETFCCVTGLIGKTFCIGWIQIFSWLPLSFAFKNLAARLESMITRSLEFGKHCSISNPPQSRNFQNPSVSPSSFTMSEQQCVLQRPSALQSNPKIFWPNFHSYSTHFFNHLF